MDGFQAVARAPAVTGGVVAERRPRVHPRQEIIRLRGDLALGTYQRAARKLINKGQVLYLSPQLICESDAYLVSTATLSTAFGPVVAGCLSVVFHELYGAGKDGSIGWKVYRRSGLST